MVSLASSKERAEFLIIVAGIAVQVQIAQTGRSSQASLSSSPAPLVYYGYSSGLADVDTTMVLSGTSA